MHRMIESGVTSFMVAGEATIRGCDTRSSDPSALGTRTVSDTAVFECSTIWDQGSNNNLTRRSVLAGLFGTTMLTQAKAFGDGSERILLLWGDQSASTFVLNSGSYLGLWDERVSSA